MAQWAHFGRVRAPFHLYVPAGRRRHRPPALRREPGDGHRDLELPLDRRPDPVHAGAARRPRRTDAAPAPKARRPTPTAKATRQAGRRRSQAAAPSAPPSHGEEGPPAKRQAAKTRTKAAKQEAKEEVSPAAPPLRPRSARLRNHGPRRRPAGAAAASALLYWFRTPPGVRVGRAPIDETAIRLLEAAQSRRAVRLDADPEGRPPPKRPARRDRGRARPRSARPPRARARPQRPLRAAATAAAFAAAPNSHARPSEASSRPDGMRIRRETPVRRRPRHRPRDGRAVDAPDAADRTPRTSGPRDAACDAQPPSAGGGRRSRGEAERPCAASSSRARMTGSASYQRLGAEGLVRLRARYAEVMARIAERPLEEDGAGRAETARRASKPRRLGHGGRGDGRARAVRDRLRRAARRRRPPPAGAGAAGAGRRSARTEL